MGGQGSRPSSGVAPLARAYLIVDDSPVIRLTVQKMLVQLGVDPSSIHAASDGESALEAFEELRPDAVFLDIEMPGLDGEQAAHAMLMTHPETKVIVVSGLDPDDERIRRLVSLGAFEVVRKPVHSVALRELLSLMDGEDRGLQRIG